MRLSRYTFDCFGTKADKEQNFFPAFVRIVNVYQGVVVNAKSVYLNEWHVTNK